MTTSPRRRAPKAPSFGALMAQVRIETGESLEVFAQRLGVARQNLWEIEQDRRTVSYQRAAEWADALGFEPKDFVRAVVQQAISAAELPYTVQLATPSA